jgi:hypothetical protein
MRRALLIVVGGVVVTFLACRTTQPPGTENAQPIGAVTDQEPAQLMPAQPPGPSSPIMTEDGGTPP